MLNFIFLDHGKANVKRIKRAAEQLAMDQLKEKKDKNCERQRRSRIKLKISQPVSISMPLKTKGLKEKQFTE